jgi:hypothetical protein
MTSWAAVSPVLTALRQVDEPLAQRFFNTPDSVVFGEPQPGWVTATAKGYASFASLAADAGQPAAWVLYDNEAWQGTPLIEQQHPKAYMDAAVTLAHARGKQVMCSPSPGLMRVAGADHMPLPGEAGRSWYLRCGMVPAAAGAEVLIVQSQTWQSDASVFADFVHGARAQRPDQTLWAGLTTLRGDPVQAMVRCYRAVDGAVDGFWLNSSAATITTAAEFLRKIQ